MTAASLASQPADRAPAATRTLAAGCAIGAGASWHITNAGALAGTLADHYGTSLAVVGLLTSAMFLSELAMMVPAGRWIDRLGARETGLAGLVVAGLASAALTAGGGIGVAIALRLVVGAGAILAFLGGAAYVQSAIGTSLAQGIYGGLGLATSGIALVVVPLLAGPLGWRTPWAVAAVGTAACALLALAGPRLRAGAAGGATSSFRLAADPAIARLGALHAASFGFSVVLGNWTATLVDRAGFGDAFGGAVGALTLCLGVVARPAGGWLARSGPAATRAVQAAGVALGATGGLMLCAAPGTAAAAVAGAALVGLGGGLPFGTLFTGAARAHPQQVGTAMAAMNMYALVAVIVGIPLVGVTFALPGAGRIGFALASGACLASLLVVRRVR